VLIERIKRGHNVIWGSEVMAACLLNIIFYVDLCNQLWEPYALPPMSLWYTLNMKMSWTTGLVVIVNIETFTFAQNGTSIRLSSSLQSLYTLSYVVKYRRLKIMPFFSSPLTSLITLHNLYAGSVTLLSKKQNFGP